MKIPSDVIKFSIRPDFQVGSVADFLRLTPAEEKEIEQRIKKDCSRKNIPKTISIKS